LAKVAEERSVKEYYNTGINETRSILESAIAYRRRGFSVIPIRPQNKKPYVAWEPFQIEAPSEQTIEHWFTSWPQANIGLVTGAVSDCVVIDLDSTEAKDKIKSLVTNYDLGGVPRVRTGRGGHHLFFKHPGGTIQTRAGVLPKTDIRADGGYVVTAPSIHENGKPYKWEVNISGELPALPPELYKLITKPTGENNSGYGEKFNTANALSGVPEGQRDESLFRLACTLRGADIPRDIAEKLILEAARNCQPPFPERIALEEVSRAYQKYEPRQTQAAQPAKQAEIWPEFQSAEQILNQPDETIVYRWDECLPAAGSSILVAQPKIGKTTFAANLALAIARGVPFLERATQQCPVAFAYLDGPPREIKDSFKSLGLKGSDPVFIHAGAAPADYLEWIMAQVEQHRIRFFVIDTFQKFFKIQNINDYSEVINKSAAMLDAAAAKDVHLLFVHHAGKGDRGDLDSAIGSTAIRGQAQSYLHLKLLPDSARRIFRTDQRNGRGNFPEVAIGFDRYGWLEIKGAREDAEIEDAIPQIAEFIEAEGGDVTEKAIRAALQIRTIILSKAIRQMFKDGKIDRTGKGRKNSPFHYSMAMYLDSVPGEGVIGEGVAGTESKKQRQHVENITTNSVPNNAGTEREQHGTEFFAPMPGTESAEWENVPR
jgi:hypothetical protein